MSAPAFELPRRARGRRAARGARRCARRRPADGRDALCRADPPRAVRRAGRRCSTPATCWSSTSRPRCPQRFPRPRGDGSEIRVHVATRAPRLDSSWRVVELRTADGSRPLRGRAGEALELPDGASLRAGGPVRVGRAADARPVRRGGRSAGVSGPPRSSRSATATPAAAWPLDAYQNVYARTPGSAEMPSAGRPFTPGLITSLAASRRAVRADHAARRRVVARASRAAVPRAVRGPGEDRPAGRRGARVGRACHRGRDHRRARARDRGRRGRRCPRALRLDRTRRRRRSGGSARSTG